MSEYNLTTTAMVLNNYKVLYVNAADRTTKDQILRQAIDQLEAASKRVGELITTLARVETERSEIVKLAEDRLGCISRVESEVGGLCDQVHRLESVLNGTVVDYEWPLFQRAAEAHDERDELLVKVERLTAQLPNWDLQQMTQQRDALLHQTMALRGNLRVVIAERDDARAALADVRDARDAAINAHSNLKLERAHFVTDERCVAEELRAMTADRDRLAAKIAEFGAGERQLDGLIAKLEVPAVQQQQSERDFDPWTCSLILGDFNGPHGEIPATAHVAVDHDTGDEHAHDDEDCDAGERYLDKWRYTAPPEAPPPAPPPAPSPPDLWHDLREACLVWLLNYGGSHHRFRDLVAKSIATGMTRTALRGGFEVSCSTVDGWMSGTCRPHLMLRIQIVQFILGWAGCDHKEWRWGNDYSLRYGSHRTQVCVNCRTWRSIGHNMLDAGRWRPASEYEAATAPREDD